MFMSEKSRIWRLFLFIVKLLAVPREVEVIQISKNPFNDNGLERTAIVRLMSPGWVAAL